MKLAAPSRTVDFFMRLHAFRAPLRERFDPKVVALLVEAWIRNEARKS